MQRKEKQSVDEPRRLFHTVTFSSNLVDDDGFRCNEETNKSEKSKIWEVQQRNKYSTSVKIPRSSLSVAMSLEIQRSGVSETKIFVSSSETDIRYPLHHVASPRLGAKERRKHSMMVGAQKQNERGKSEMRNMYDTNDSFITLIQYNAVWQQRYSCHSECSRCKREMKSENLLFVNMEICSLQ